MAQRTVYPAKTPTELTQSDHAYHDALRLAALSGAQPDRPVKAVIRCNQLTRDNAGACDFSHTITVRSADAERTSTEILFDHFRGSHRYMTRAQARNLANRAWISLMDATRYVR